jgi:hypothetical protein
MRLDPAKVGELAALLAQAGFPDRLPQIQNDPSSTLDFWTTGLFRVSVDFAREAVYELVCYELVEGEDLASLRSAVQFLYQMVGRSSGRQLF